MANEKTTKILFNLEIINDAWKLGERIGGYYGWKTCNPAATYIAENTNMGIGNRVVNMWSETDDECYQLELDFLNRDVKEFCASI